MLQLHLAPVNFPSHSPHSIVILFYIPAFLCSNPCQGVGHYIFSAALLSKWLSSVSREYSPPIELQGQTLFCAKKALCQFNIEFALVVNLARLADPCAWQCDGY